MFYVFFIYSIPLQIIHSPVSLEWNSSICLSQKLECSVIWNSDYSYWISKNSSRRTTQRHKQYNTLYIYWKIWNQIHQPNFWLKSKTHWVHLWWLFKHWIAVLSVSYLCEMAAKWHNKSNRDVEEEKMKKDGTNFSSNFKTVLL